MLNKKHWFAFSYIGKSPKGGIGQAWASAYTGYPDKSMTVACINENKWPSGVDKNATLIAVGYMTRGQMVGGSGK